MIDFLGAKRHTLRRRTKTCARPDCSLTKLDTDSEEYVIERLVGRKTIGDARYLFLVKWEGCVLFFMTTYWLRGLILVSPDIRSRKLAGSPAET